MRIPRGLVAITIDPADGHQPTNRKSARQRLEAVPASPRFPERSIDDTTQTPPASPRRRRGLARSDEWTGLRTHVDRYANRRSPAWSRHAPGRTKTEARDVSAALLTAAARLTRLKRRMPRAETPQARPPASSWRRRARQRLAPVVTLIVETSGTSPFGLYGAAVRNGPGPTVIPPFGYENCHERTPENRA
jgi:hypothetical protein